MSEKDKYKQAMEASRAIWETNDMDTDLSEGHDEAIRTLESFLETDGEDLRPDQKTQHASALLIASALFSAVAVLSRIDEAIRKHAGE